MKHPLFSKTFAFALSCLTLAPSALALNPCAETLRTAIKHAPGDASQFDTMSPEMGIVLTHFLEISKFFRDSKSEAAIREWIIGKARKLGLQVEQDPKGNFLVRKPGYGFLTGAEPVAIQAHLDMVLDAKGKKKSEFPAHFANGVGQLELVNGYIQSVNQTNSIGADNGLALAMMIRIMEDPRLIHPPLELVFTVEEEIGLIGAAQFGLNLQARKLINIDNDEFGTLINGSMASNRLDAKSENLATTPIPTKHTQVVISFDNFEGGHGGTKIHLGRANSVLVSARLFDKIKENIPAALLISLEAGAEGVFTNIPKQFSLTISIPSNQRTTLARVVGFEWSLIAAEHSATDRDAFKMDLHVASTPQPFETAVDPAVTQRWISTVRETRIGGVIWNQAFINGNEATSNLGFLVLRTGTTGGYGHFGIMPRSFLNESRDRYYSEEARRISSALPEVQIAKLAPFPAWQPNPGSALAAAFVQVASERGISYNVEGKPAGLEPCFFYEGFPGMDSICVGPNSPDAHGNKERFELKSTQAITILIDDLLRKLATPRLPGMP